MRRIPRLRAALLSTALLPVVLVATTTVSGATTPGTPDQAQCDPGGSVNPTWDQTGVTTRPSLVSAVIGGETVSGTDLATPVDGKIGMAICAQDPNFAKNSSIAFFRRIGAHDATMDLTGAQTPGGVTITASTPITITVSLGDLSPYFTFATVFGNVDAWATTGLRSAAATLTATLRASDAVMVDGNIPAEQGCTQQPPNCSAPQADYDFFGLSMQLKAERDNPGFDAIAGGYFALRSAIGGYVQPLGSSVDVTLGGPHLKSDGTTLNVGSMTAFIPDAALSSWFGITSAEVSSSTLAITRTEGASTSSAAWSSRVVPGGVAIDVPDITFSSPRYRIVGSRSSGSGSGGGGSASPSWPRPARFGVHRHGRRVTASFVVAAGARYQVVMTNGRRTYVVDVRSTSRKAAVKAVRRTLSRGTWVVYARLRVGKGFGRSAAAVIRV